MITDMLFVALSEWWWTQGSWVCRVISSSEALGFSSEVFSLLVYGKPEFSASAQRWMLASELVLALPTYISLLSFRKGKFLLGNRRGPSNVSHVFNGDTRGGL